MSHHASNDPKDPADCWLNTRATESLRYPAPGSWLQPVSDHTINLASGYPFPNAIPHEAIREAMNRLVAEEQDAPFQYGGSVAGQGLNHWVGASVESGNLMSQKDSYLITQGAIQGLDLLCQVVLDKEAVVLVQGPTYMEALEIFHNYTDQVVDLRCDLPGRDFAEVVSHYLAAAPNPGAVTLLYLGSSFQNPTGQVLSRASRESLIALARRYNFLIVEDGAYDALYFERPLPALKALDATGHVIYLGTFSKTIAPGLRIGWVVGPAALIDAMGRFKKDLGNPLIAAITSRYLADTDFEVRLDWLRSQYRLRGELAQAALTEFMPTSITWLPPRGGFFIWLRYPDSLSNERLLEESRRQGVSFIPGQYFYPFAASTTPHALRICFSYETPDHITEGIRRLGLIFESI